MERHTRSYLQLIKPGITLSNTIAAAAGLALGSSVVAASTTTVFGLIVGTMLVIASACVVNNITDRNIDRKMKRTSKRELAMNAISVPKAGLFATLLGLAGFTTLFLWTNPLTTFIGLVAVIWYVIIYGLLKRHSLWSTIVGGVAGALPPVAGYVAAVGQIDAAAIILFFMMYFWQMPHFYAIAIFRKQDYVASGLPIWTVRRNVSEAKLQMLIFTFLFALTGPLLTVFGYTGLWFAFGIVVLSLYWVSMGVILYNKFSDEVWAKRMFRISLVVMLAMSALVAIGGYTP